ncbi:SDR family oxidoreductase [Sphingomonas bacterium]|uniref:SDR family oxidoreductase n=1 Tax=Sphingomonas bacterium TaxID=1895847 RepID=UPI0015774E7B|nr:SDR family oxidoreductase [Sphingomonas bacterium]
MIRLKPLADQVIVITGASSGIGRATALMAAARGASVVAAARGSEGLASLVAEIAAVRGLASACVTDVSDAAAVDRLATHAVETFGRIDTWVNNAGVAIAGKLEDLSDEDARRVFDINFWGTVHGCKAALPHLKAQGGVLINVGSVASDVAAPFMGLYSASKHAIKGYTDALRIELMTDRAPVAVTLVKPAPIATPILEHQRNRMDRQATMPPPFYRPDDVARTILHAAQNPERDLYVGGAGVVGSLLGQAFPNVADAAAALLGPRLFRTSQPRDDRPDNLDGPGVKASTDGSTHGHVSHPSIYTALRTGPLRRVGSAGGLGRMLLQGIRGNQGR